MRHLQRDSQGGSIKTIGPLRFTQSRIAFGAHQAKYEVKQPPNLTLMLHLKRMAVQRVAATLRDEQELLVGRETQARDLRPRHALWCYIETGFGVRFSRKGDWKREHSTATLQRHLQ